MCPSNLGQVRQPEMSVYCIEISAVCKCTWLLLNWDFHLWRIPVRLLIILPITGPPLHHEWNVTNTVSNMCLFPDPASRHSSSILYILNYLHAFSKSSFVYSFTTFVHISFFLSLSLALSVPTASMTRLARSRTHSASSMNSVEGARSRSHNNSQEGAAASPGHENQARPQTMEVSC